MPPPPLCDIPSGCCFFTGPWTVAHSSLRMLRRVTAFCRPLRPVLLLVSFPRLRSAVVGVPGLCWMWRDVPFARQRRPIIGVLRMCWLLWGSFHCFCCPPPPPPQKAMWEMQHRARGFRITKRSPSVVVHSSVVSGIHRPCTVQWVFLPPRPCCVGVRPINALLWGLGSVLPWLCVPPRLCGGALAAGVQR